jgi:ElaB/YqjD/DUF883 family membrane-anchored ribosome-binding protein
MASKHDELPENAKDAGEAAAALVGEGIDAVKQAGDDAELREIGTEIDRIKGSVAQIAESTSHYVKRRVAENSTDLISHNPVKAALWAAFIGFVIGRLSR